MSFDELKGYLPAVLNTPAERILPSTEYWKLSSLAEFIGVDVVNGEGDYKTLVTTYINPTKEPCPLSHAKSCLRT